MATLSGTRTGRTVDGWAACLAGFLVGVLVPLVALLLVLVGPPPAAALPAALLAGALLFAALLPRVPEEWSDALRRQRRWVRVLWVLASVTVVVVTARMAVFMADPDRAEFSLAPSIEFMVEHTHLSGYVSGALIAEREPDNLYDIDRYGSPEQDAVLPAVTPLNRDIYVYPPPFLLLPRALLALSDDFFTLRAGWYALYAAAVLGAMLAVARWVRGREGAILAVLTPAIWVSLPLLATLQLGNIHVLVVYAAAVGAMVLFTRRRHAVGGALLAFAILSKVSPAALGLYLLVQRRWAAVAWTAAFGGIYSLATLLVFGLGPFEAFLGGGVWRALASGEFQAFVLDWTPAVLINYSPFGIPHKLALLGVEIADPMAAGRLLSNLYTLAVLALVIVVALRLRGREQAPEQGPRERLEQLVVWLALLTLASFRAPFAPWTYTAVGAVWLFAAYAPLLRPTARSVALLAACWFLVSVYGPPVPVPMVIFTFLAQAVIYGSGFLLALRASSPTAPAAT